MVKGRMTASAKRRLEATAYHEAGHAVADRVLGFTSTGATIVRQGETLGRAGALEPWCAPEKSPRENRRDGRRYVVVLLAGHAAEVEFCGKAEQTIGGAASDLEQAEKTLHLLGERGLEPYRVRARRLVRRHRAKVRRVAEELLRQRTLDDSELELLMMNQGRYLSEYRSRRVVCS